MESQPQNTGTEKILSPAKLAHVVLRTANFKSMVAFYKTFLGAHASYENGTLSFLTYDEEHHRVAIIGIPETKPKDSNSAGLDHLAFTFNTLHDLMLAYQQRKTRGIVPFWCVNHGPTVSMYYQDPDGNKIELQVDAFETVDEESTFFASSAFAENPIGVDLDPEDLIKRLRDGEDEGQLKKRPDIGPRKFDSVPIPAAPVSISI
ncbi:hypothetical protein PFICI_13454 [Pestalotiopsis fici W106-1]|uniref:VOC domain-containing protein n=1 Tax=Pestalotiopsis fici (strain W106-1 / CGMCC3.15140) TaxID=1229662 RepID=W3WM21_PESFW|nr:uncharacterized protein PFICI_13454 [Pestalotiopsis fici W106-1]ETS74970.1 hypothetical protein PFICI_13454 [Pestalotiopsis fici W106-1]